MDDRVLAYAEAVARGAGFAPGQSDERVSEAERTFRDEVERRKDRMLDSRRRVRHPALITEDDLEQARRNIASADWARAWFDRLKGNADHIVAQDEGYVELMLEATTPWCGYSFFCPNCFGVRTFEGTEYNIIDWDSRHPDVIACKVCGHSYPSEQYPEDIALECPRRGERITFHRNPAQRANPDNRTGELAWKWAARPVHPSFTGIIRELKAQFLVSHARPLALLHQLTGDARYARRCREILLRLAWCVRHAWLYHDYWDTAADCDPIYAAWHDKKLPLTWKRNLFTSAYADDTPDTAAMRQGYWGAGRLHPSTGMVGVVPGLCEAYDLLRAAKDEQGRAVLSARDRVTIEKDLLLEWLIESEPFVGGEGRTDNASNKAPRIYHAMAAVAKTLGLTNYARTALAGYEAVRDRSFAHDGFSHETPSYNEMFLGELLWIPERLHGFRLPATDSEPARRVDLYRSDAKLRLMLAACMDQLRPDGRRLPLGDSHDEVVPRVHGSIIWEVGLKRLPEVFAHRVPTIYRHRGMTPTEYATLRLPATLFDQQRDDDGKPTLALPELCFPGWMVALLRAGDGLDGSIASLSFSPAGGHRHYDNLALFYADRGRTVLGDHGYLAEAPAQRWVKHTFSHNLVIFDDQVQAFRSDMERVPAFHYMATSPLASMVEASSKVYEQCERFARTIVMLKGPDGRSLLVDVCRVAGGQKHAYRLFSEIASSDAGARGTRSFEGLAMPPEPALPNIGASEREADIFGLRDAVCCDAPSDHWQATWREPGSAYRLWMLSDSDRVIAANGPGQAMWNEPSHVGRRLRYLDVVRESTGDPLRSTFVTVHEPAATGDELPVRRAERLAVPPEAGPDAIAISLATSWGDYIVLLNFDHEAAVAGVRFQGHMAVIHTTPAGAVGYLAVAASTLKIAGTGFSNSPTEWRGQVTAATHDRLTSDTPRPPRWPRTPQGVGAFVAVRGPKLTTGYPVRSATAGGVRVDRFPLDAPQSFALPAVRYKASR